jgi:D-glycero-D-manno-heptose 1,7-bisphosphate phosphatase
MNGTQVRRRAVFLDRDGTIIVDKNYLSRPEDVELVPNAGQALRRLQDAGYILIIVSNQSGVGRGYFTMEDVERVNQRLLEELKKFGVKISKIYVAPEAPDQPSRGRKPSPAFLFDAADEFGVDLQASYVIGDKLSDLECGWNAGVRAAILVRTGYGQQTQERHPEILKRAIIVDDLAAAADWIISQSFD